MDRPSSSGESLEAILASIRRSLAEQATDVLAEEPVATDEAEAPVAAMPAAEAGPAAVDLEAPPLPQSVSEQLAAIVAADVEGGDGMHPAAPVPAGSPPLRERLREPLPEIAPRTAPETMPQTMPAAIVTPVVAASRPAAESAMASTAAATSMPAAAPEPAAAPPMPVEEPAVAEATRVQAKEPLWFLAQEGAKAGEPGAGRVPPARPAPAARTPAPAAEPFRPQSVEPRAPEPKPQPRPGVLRGPLPPFFGSSAEAVKIDAASDAPGSANGSVILGAGSSVPDAMPPPPAAGPSPPPAGPPPQGMARVAPSDAERRAGPVAPGHNPGSNSPDGWPRAAEPSATVSKPGGLFGPMPGEPRTAGDAGMSPQLQALEVMVAELLRPMLRRWLDENMPRLVSAALKAEAQLLSERDRKKS